nr:hypothetical protein [Tanacetum cinerariifolium]
MEVQDPTAKVQQVKVLQKRKEWQLSLLLNMHKRRNDVKARTTLLLALPDEHQLRFSKYETAQELWGAILKTFGGNEATKKTKKNQLKQQYGNFKAEGSKTLEQTFNRLQAIVSHLEFMDVEIEQDDLNQKFLTSLAPEWLMYTIVWRNIDDLNTMSLDDVYNHLKVYEPEVQKKSESKNMAFISSANTSSGKGKVHTASVLTASTQVSTASIDVAAASISHDIIDEDDIEEMDIKWNMALLSMRANRFWKKTGKKITVQGTDVAGFDKSKVECFNCHKMGHFARECRAPRSQDRGRRENNKQGSKEEEPAPKALMAIDGIGWDWSYMANEEENHALVPNDEAPTEFALMAKSSSSSENKVKKEKEGLDSKLTGFESALKDLDTLLVSQRTDKNKEGLGYSVVPPPLLLKSTLLPRKITDDTITDYSRPSPSIESNTSDLQNTDSPTVIKTNKVKTAKKSTVKYAEMYRNTSKSPKVRGGGRITGKGTSSTNIPGIKDVVSQGVKKDVSYLRYISLLNWFHEARMEYSNCDAQDACNADVSESSEISNPTATSKIPATDQMESLTVESVIPIVSSPIPTACLDTSPETSSGSRLISKKEEPKKIYDALKDPSWVLKNKKDKRGIVIRNKVRLVAQGHTQEEVYQMDVKSAFLYGTIDEEVYVMQPPGFQDLEFPDRVYKVERGTIDQTLFIRKHKGDFLLVQVHQVTPKECHLHVVKRIFRYLKGHPKLRLLYLKESPFDLVAYSDSDYGGATQDRKSTTGGCQFLGRRLISWQCKKQTIVATFTTEA